MDTPEDSSYTEPDPTPMPRWVTVAFVVLFVGLILGFLFVLIRAGRRSGPALALVAGSAIAGSVLAPKVPRKQRTAIDTAFVQTRLRHIAQVLRERDHTSLIPPTQLLHALNNLLKKSERALLSSTQELARVLGSLGLKSQVRTVAGRSERRWYDLTGYGTHEAPTQ